jgi:hypothetical protein
MLSYLRTIFYNRYHHYTTPGSPPKFSTRGCTLDFTGGVGCGPFSHLYKSDTTPFESNKESNNANAISIKGDI